MLGNHLSILYFIFYDNKYEVDTTIIIPMLQIRNWSTEGDLSSATQWFWVHWEESFLIQRWSNFLKEID